MFLSIYIKTLASSRF